MAPPQKVVAAVLLMITMVFLFCNNTVKMVAATWCVTRSEASDQVLQVAMDYACGAGADCTPILPNGLCYLPNTIQAHAAYAFNSYYQRMGEAASSCTFGGTATIAKTDPSYGSCVYPSSPSTAGGTITSGGGTPGSTTTPMTMPTPTPRLTAPPPPPPGPAMPLYGPGGSMPGTGPAVPNAQNTLAASELSIIGTLLVSLLLFFSIILQPL